MRTVKNELELRRVVYYSFLFGFVDYLKFLTLRLFRNPFNVKRYKIIILRIIALLDIIRAVI